MFNNLLKRIKEKSVKNQIKNLEAFCEDLSSRFYEIKSVFDGIGEVDCSELEDRVNDIENRLYVYDPEDIYDKAQDNENEIDDIRNRCDDLEMRCDDLENYPQTSDKITKAIDNINDDLKALYERKTTISDFKAKATIFFLSLDIKKKDKTTFKKLLSMLDNLE